MEPGRVKAPTWDDARRVDRRGMAFKQLILAVIVVVLVCTSVVSLALMSPHEDMVITVDAGSYYAVHIGVYGWGTIELTHSMSDGSSMYLMRLDRLNYDKFVDGDDYTYTRYTTVSSGGSLETGMIWEHYLVFVNEGLVPGIVQFEYEVTCYFSMPAAALILAATAGACHYLSKRFSWFEQPDEAPETRRTRTREVRKAIALIACLAVVPIAVMYSIGQVVPSDTFFGRMYGHVAQRLFLGVLASLVVVLLLRLRLMVVPGTQKQVLARLTHQLRVSGLRVAERRGSISVRISSLVGVRIKATPRPYGTLITYRAEPAPTGWGVIIILLWFNLTAVLSLAVALYMLYRSAEFAGGRVSPRLSGAPSSQGVPAEESTKSLLIDSLSEARRLSSESYEAARSNYHDSILMTTAVAFVLAAVLAAAEGRYLLQDLESQLAGHIFIGTVLVIGVATSILAWRVLARRYKSKIEDLRQWSTRLEMAISREVGATAPADSEPSAFELVVDAYRQLPHWLEVRRRGGMFREPGYWILIMIFSLMAFSIGFGGALTLLTGDQSRGATLLLISAAFVGLAVFVYMQWRRLKSEEEHRISKDWTTRFDSLKAEMESYLRSV